MSPAIEPPLDGERKTVTALFADIKGSMELMEELDREEAADLGQSGVDRDQRPQTGHLVDARRE